MPAGRDEFGGPGRGTGVGDPEQRRRYEMFAAYLLAGREPERPTREELADRFGVSLDTVRHALDEVRKRYERLLRQEVRDRVGSEEEVEVELRNLG